MREDFDKYYEATEPGMSERAHAWATAIGLQEVDGLKPSKYLIATAKRHIEGEISQEEARRHKRARCRDKCRDKFHSAGRCCHESASAQSKTDGIKVGRDPWRHFTTGGAHNRCTKNQGWPYPQSFKGKWRLAFHEIVTGLRGT